MTGMRNHLQTRGNRICLAVITAFFVLLIFAIVSASYGTVRAEEEIQEHINGLVPVEKEFCQVGQLRKGKLRQFSQVFPDTYRSDEQPWAAGIRVKDQGNTGLCWAFSMTTAAEYSYAKEFFEESGAVCEISPGHLGYFYYNRVDDPLGLTGGDRNFSIPSKDWALIGGNQINGMQHLATWSGEALEAEAPFSRISSHVSGNRWDGTIPYEDQAAYQNYATLQESVFYRGLDVNTIKRLLLEYGAVSTGIRFDYDLFMNPDETWVTEEGEETGKNREGRSFYNYSDELQANHAVTIIGWDDTYPKENFTHERDFKGKLLTYTDYQGRKQTYTPEEARLVTTPESDGAWIVQNSWGTGSHENGIFYVSYESRDFVYEMNDFSVYDMQPADTFLYNFQYDGTADCGDSSDPGNEDFFTKEGTSAANVFTNSTDIPILLSAVGFTTYNNGLSNYSVSVYVDLEDPEDPCSGIFAGTTCFTTDTVGVKSAELKEPVVIDPGETFSIVFNFETPNAFGTERWRISEYQVEVNPGQSFFRGAGSKEWTDLYSYGACFRIKGFATEGPAACENHNWDDGVVSVPASCSREGTRVLSCSLCGRMKREPIAKTSHTPEIQKAKEASCTEPGLTEGAVCSVCGEILSAQETVPATGHHYHTKVQKATFSVDGYITDVCDCGAIGSASIIRKIETVTLKKNSRSFVYNGKVQRPEVTVKDSGGKTIPEEYYTLSWSKKNSKAAGTYSVNVIFKGNYSGTKSLNYQIRKAENRILKVTPSAKTFKFSRLRKKEQSFSIKAVDLFDAKKKYALSSVSPKKAKKYFKVSSSGKVTVKAKTPGGTYYLKIKVSASGTKNYKKTTCTKKIRVNVK